MKTSIQKADRIARATWHFQGANDYEVHFARVPADYINSLPEEIPEVKELIRFQNHERKYVRVGENKFRPEFAWTTDAKVFEVFDFPLLSGNAETALAEPNSVVISRKMAEKLFGSTKALGRTITMVSDFQSEDSFWEVTAVMEDLPGNTHLPVDMMFSFADESERSGWAYVYLLLEDGASLEQLQGKMEGFVDAHSQAQAQGSNSSSNSISLELQGLEEIHLNSNLAREIIPNGDQLYVRIFLVVGLFILLIAMINYVNLSSAMMISRGKEVGMKSILGAEKGQLIRDVLIESLLYNLLAVGLGLLLCKLSFPWFSSLMGIEMLMSFWLLAGILTLIAIICGLLAGIYPAIILTSFRALDVIKSSKSIRFRDGKQGLPLRRVMLGIQFCASVLLIGSAILAWNQVNYLQNKNLGLSKEQILALPAVPNMVKDQFQVFRDRLLSSPEIEQIAACMEVPSREIRDAGPVLVSGVNSNTDEAPMMDVQIISPGFVDLMNLELIDGEDRITFTDWTPVPEFSEDFSPNQYLNERRRTYLINETAMKQLGWATPEEAIGQQINWSIGGFTMAYGPVTGVVKDFHQESLKNKIDPTILFFEPIWLNTFLLKVKTKNMPQTISKINGVWDEMFPAYPMEYHFLDDLYETLYKNERQQLQLLLLLSGVAIFIAFTGLFALIAWTLKTRFREIAIRKILGADALDLIRMISRDYVIILLGGALAGIPLSYYWVSQWMENFAYREDISLWAYVLTLGLIGLLLLLTVSVQTLMTSFTNPAETLRDE